MGGVSAPYTLTKSVEYAREYRALPKPTKMAQSRLSSRHVGGNWIPGCLMHAHKNRQPHPQSLPPSGRPQRKEGGIAQVFQKHSASRFHAWIPPLPDSMSGWRPQSKAVFVVMGVGWEWDGWGRKSHGGPAPLPAFLMGLRAVTPRIIPGVLFSAGTRPSPIFHLGH